MFMKKILLSALICAAMTFSVFAGFELKNEYTKGQFTDVKESEWYAPSVESVYELGLMNGIGGGLFSPDTNVTVAEIITMTARARAIHDGETIRAAADGESWYAPYVEYAVSKGYVTEGKYTDAELDAPAKRYEVAVMFKGSMPDGYYTNINYVTAIPDVSEDKVYYNDVIAMYNAGILMGSDEKGTFYPENNITRAEVATMITRVAMPEKRVKKTTPVSGFDAYTIVETDRLFGSFETVASGWRLDNRGGIPRSAANSNGDFTVTDMMDNEGTALIREFNAVKEGKLVLETVVSVSGINTDGVFLEFRTSKGHPVYRIETKGSSFMYLNEDGTYSELYTFIDGEAKFYFNITLDLSNGTSTTYVNGSECGVKALAKADFNDVGSFRYGTTDESKATYAVSNVVKLTANYAVNDDFTFDETGAMPLGYSGENASKASGLEVKPGGYASKKFADVTGIVIAEAELLMVDGMSFTLADGNEALVEITVNNGKVYANGAEIYDYHSDIWYRLRLECDTNTGKALVKLNGRKIADTTFTASKANTITFANNGSENALYDTVRVYEKVIHEDYVPKPVVPKGTEKYTVGINICSLWRNGHHYGWAPITPYEEPVLGYYDEGSPESADWEIKYMVEHGIDFQSFCWFPDKKDGPLKELECRYQLHDGFMNAEYSDMMKYCLIWECANAKTPRGIENWKKYYVPYMIENYFKDSRYMTIDNRLVFCVFGAGNLNAADAFGSWQGTREAFDYLEEEVKSLGFDGMLYLALGTSNETLALMGFDASYAYSWSRDGYKVDHNKNSMIASYNVTDKMYTVPTVSVGFNDIAWWGGKRYPLMTVEDYRTTNKWVVEEYLPTYGTKEAWQNNFVMLSTWNEYGEGTYIMPSKNNGGFGYLDVLRETYTDEKADASVNTVPTDAQKERINRLYPAHHSLVKYQDYYKPELDESLYPCFYTIYANGDEEKSASTINNYKENGATLSGETKSDGYIVFKNVMELDLEIITKLKLKIKVPAGNQIEIFFITNKDKVWDAGKSFKLRSTSDEMTEYVIDTTDNPNWKNTLTEIRVDPAWSEGVAFEFESLAFMSDPIKKTFTVTVDGVDRKMKYPSATSETGEYLAAFDTISFPEICAAFFTWNKDEKSLKIEANKHSVTFILDKDTYIVDGVEKPLGFKLYELDSQPMIPVKKLCDALGYGFNETSEEVFVETTRKEYYDIINARKPGTWDFNLDGDTETWTSTFMSLAAQDGYLHCESMTSSTDPVLRAGTVGLLAEKYNKLEIRVRYKYDKAEPTRIAMFFLTNLDPTWNEDKCIRQLHESTDSKGEWVTYTFDLAEFPAWKDTVIQLRFDPFDAVGEMDIDYIRFVEDPNWIDPALRPFEIRNGDAEGETIEFESQNGTVSLMSEGENTAYQVISKPGKQWLYIYQNVTYKPKKAYTFEYDIKLADTDINPMLKNDTVVYINCNVQFNDPTSKTDHVVLSTPIRISDGWVHCTGKFTVPGASEVRTLDKFSVYSNPISDAGIAYYLDNVVVKEVED